MLNKKMPERKNIKTSDIRVCRVNRKVFEYTLLWPKEGTEINPGFSYKVKIFAYFFSTFFINSAIVMHIVIGFKGVNESVNAEDIAITIADFGNYYMVIYFLKKRRDFVVLLHHLSDFKSFGLPPGFEDLDRQLNFLAKCLLTYIFIGISVNNFIKLPTKSKCKIMNAEAGTNGNYCGLMFPFWIPFHIDYFPVFFLIFVYGLLTSQLHMKMSNQISFHVFEIAHHTILRIKHLKNMILECFEDANYEVSRGKLRYCILYHNDILNLSEKLDNAFSGIMFGHFAFTGTICACIEKQIVDGHNVYPGIMHFCGWIAALFLSCLGGQKLVNASDIIPEALWNSKWYEADVRLRKSVIIMLIRSQKNIYIKAGPFGMLGFPLFVSVLKTSYSILCMLTS